MAQKSMAPLGTQISYALKARGVDVVFGIPGVHNQELYRGLEEAGLRHILARHEQGAGFMADGYARATGRAGVAFVITGPGLCNVMTALGQAYSDSVPLLVFSSCLDDIETRKGQLHQMKDQEGAARHCACAHGHQTTESRQMSATAATGPRASSRPPSAATGPSRSPVTRCSSTLPATRTSLSTPAAKAIPSPSSAR